MFATIIEVAEINGQYGIEKKSRIQLDDGESKTAYTKPAAKGIYEALRPGLRVELTPKSSGAGYLIKSIIGEAPSTPPAPPSNGQAPANNTGYGKAGRPTAEEIAKYIDNKAGHIARAYVSLGQHFSALGKEFTPEIFAATISTVIISLDRHFGNDAADWGDSRPLLVAGSPEWEKTVAAIQKHGAGTVDKVVAKARVSPTDEEYLRYIEKQASE